MTTTRTLIAAALFALPLACAAGPADAVAGTWECRVPGTDHGPTPPILYLGAADGAETAIDVDGFAREVYGIGRIDVDAGGWWKITPEQGAAFRVRPDAAARGGRPTMQVQRDAASYRCHRVQPKETTQDRELSPRVATGLPGASQATPRIT
jgi:hypothetical protein